jgi:hypothetical protein
VRATASLVRFFREGDMEFFPILLPLFSVYIFLFCCFFLVAFVVVHSDQTRSLGLLHPLRSTFTLSPSVHHCVAPLASLKLVGFLDLVFSKLDLASSISFPSSCVIPPRFSASQLPKATTSGQIRPPRAGA